MLIAKTVSEARAFAQSQKKEDRTVGLVPTMGCLHEGHASLIKKCREQNDVVIVSVFLNPTQFGPSEDLDSYPRTFEADKRLCEELGVDLIFCPDPEEMYRDHKTYVSVEGLSKNLCGASRPIHFRGVCTVVSKLFNIITPDRAYFGEKDAQQLAIVRKMVSDLNFDIDIIGCPIVREKDGLAKSSRNNYLNAEERKAALCLSRGLEAGKKVIKTGIPAAEVTDAIKSVIDAEPLAKIGYASVVDSETIEPVETIERDVLVAIAVYIGSTRLIDNFTFKAR